MGSCIDVHGQSLSSIRVDHASDDGHHVSELSWSVAGASMSRWISFQSRARSGCVCRECT